MRITAVTTILIATVFSPALGHVGQAKRDLLEIDRGQDYRGVTYIVSIDRASRRKVADGIAVTQHQTSERASEDGSTDVVSEFVVDCAEPRYKLVRKYRTDAGGKILSDEPENGLAGGWRYGGRPGSKTFIDAVCKG